MQRYMKKICCFIFLLLLTIDAMSVSTVFAAEGAGACPKIHSCGQHTPLCALFPPHSVNAVRRACFMQGKSRMNCDVQLSESNFQTCDRKIVRVGYYRGDTSFQDGFSDDARKSGYAYEYYQKISSLTGWSYEYVYGSKAEVLDKLLSGEVDIVAGIYQTDEYKERVAFSKRDMDPKGKGRYFAVNIDRMDLLEELNQTQDKLFISSPDFTMELWQKYYGQDSQHRALTVREKNWLAEAGTLNIGYLRGNLPLSDQSGDGAPTGVIKELLSMLSAYLEVPLNPVCYDTVALMEQALCDGEIDAAFPIYSDLWFAETKGFFQTDAFISDRVMIVYQGNYREDLMDKIALSETGVGQRYYVSIYYPNAGTVYYATKADSFEALQKGEVNCMIGSSSILQRFFAEHMEYQDFHIAYLDTSENFGIAVNQGKTMLVEILNKAVRQLDDATMTSAMIQYSNVEAPYTFMDFIRHYAIVVIAALTAFFVILLWVFISYRSKMRLFNEEQAKTRAALEAALTAANAASEAKTTFLSSMSHDIRTPMNGIIGMTAIAAAHMEDPSRVKDCLAKITASSKHLLALINEVLDMSKIESGGLHLNEEVFSLSDLMDDLITLNKPLADARHHDLVVHILNISHEEVIGDSLRLQQVFTNLVSNAIKYTPDSGKIEIALSEKPSRSPKMGLFEFIVEDNGVGMSEEYLPHVFEAFTRADNASTSHTQGTGLGMAIAQNVVRMMDGDIAVESVLGQGSKFTVTVFLKLRDTENVPCADFNDLDILVVDDDQVICESACILLSELGMHGEWVLSGREAVEHVGKRHKSGTDYFAVLLDWKMPDMDGLATAGKIRECVGNDVPVIIISAYDWPSIEEEAMHAGVDGFIGKPLFKSRLVRLFEQLLGHKTEKNGLGLEELTGQTDFTGKRALLAEDNEINAEIAVEILGMTGLAVDWAHDGKEAVAQMEASAPGYYDCVFMDVQMPVMNGLDATRAIRAMSRSDAKTIPIFAMTANAFVEDVRAVLDVGMNEHIAKPLDFQVLLKVLNDYLGNNRT